MIFDAGAGAADLADFASPDVALDFAEDDEASDDRSSDGLLNVSSSSDSSPSALRNSALAAAPLMGSCVRAHMECVGGASERASERERERERECVLQSERRCAHAQKKIRAIATAKNE